ncbi:flagellar biosynthetic protein FliO [Siccibacter turicensis]|uniref:flagellar biosynthetic protein FliO n=1 Tax=Siccibacter turicensis TaxID=357233 RepID=UPI0023F3952E|nr:flagellar biosynthetic protein FliO [Siccibacter turicensis]
MKTQASVTQPDSTASSGSPLIQVSGALTVIILFILLAAWVAKRVGFAPKRGSSRDLNVSASISVGPRELIVIVDVQDARLVLGVTPTQITALHTLPPLAVDETQPAEPAGPEFQTLLKNLLKRNGRS